jgi:hypothetical protein
MVYTLFGPSRHTPNIALAHTFSLTGYVQPDTYPYCTPPVGNHLGLLDVCIYYGVGVISRNLSHTLTGKTLHRKRSFWSLQNCLVRPDCRATSRVAGFHWTMKVSHAPRTGTLHLNLSIWSLQYCRVRVLMMPT